MARIDGLSQMLTLLRRRMASAARAGRPDGSGPGARAAEAASPAVATSRSNASLESLRETMGARLADLERGSPEFDVSAARVFVESVIAWEFGDRALSDPDFAEVIGRVRDELTGDPQIAESLRQTIDQLHAKR